MIFSSVTFMFYFLPLFLVIYLQTNSKNLFLLFASLLFYTWGEVEYVAVMLFSCLVNYLLGLIIGRRNALVRKIALILGLVINIGMLITFKYMGFFLELFNNGKEVFGFDAIEIDDIHLPLGISFFTFQAITYLVDVYRREATTEKNIINLALYIAMFPQLIAGPIVRFQSIADEIRGREHSINLFVSGIKLFSIGLAQKVIIANTVAVVADDVFGLPLEELSISLAWLGVICYTLQIYFDFGGYSNMAIGLGLMMGFHFPENFRYPYIAQSITEFWRRWHKTLSGWFRDYLYIPLGGNRHGRIRTYFNLWIVFFLCGLWHGASWSFIVWGCYHGSFIVLERRFLSRYLERLWRPLRHCYTLLIVSVGWVFFRSETLTQAVHVLITMTGLNAISLETKLSVFEMMGADTWLALVIGCVAAIPTLPWIVSKMSPTQFVGNDGVVYHNALVEVCSLIGVLVVLFFTSMSLAAGAYNPFIYFRF